MSRYHPGSKGGFQKYYEEHFKLFFLPFIISILFWKAIRKPITELFNTKERTDRTENDFLKM